jgi:hypothetical protein
MFVVTSIERWGGGTTAFHRFAESGFFRGAEHQRNGAEHQRIAIEARRASARFQDRPGSRLGAAPGFPALGMVGRQHHEARIEIVGYVRAETR